MIIIHEPAVYVIARQMIDDAELDKFLSDHEVSWQTDSQVAAEVVTETAGRVCYMSFAKPRPGGNAAYLEHIKEVGHGSVLEHAVWTLIVTGVSRSLTHELVRHRAGFAYSQLSQRYVDESVAEYVEPDIIADDEELHEIWLEAVQRTHEAYVKLADKLSKKLSPKPCGVCMGHGTVYMMRCHSCDGGKPNTDKTAIRKAARQAARSVLPNATETKITITGNARALRHFIEQRGSEFADPEIRKLAARMLEVMQVEAPNLFGDYKMEPLPDGTYAIETSYTKV